MNAKMTKEEVGHKIEELLLQLNWTPRQLSEHTGIDNKVMYNLRSGKTFPGFETLLLLKKHLPELNLNWFFGAEEEPMLLHEKPGSPYPSYPSSGALSSTAEPSSEMKALLLEELKQLRQENEALKDELLSCYRRLLEQKDQASAGNAPESG